MSQNKDVVEAVYPNMQEFAILQIARKPAIFWREDSEGTIEQPFAITNAESNTPNTRNKNPTIDSTGNVGAEQQLQQHNEETLACIIRRPGSHQNPRESKIFAAMPHQLEHLRNQRCQRVNAIKEAKLEALTERELRWL
ncbi:hypothetical protein F4776DRAFT_305700 [Hypoxylon sp. NC0597]|nr:hypothetical protein F4776DRAFT_305700 [Hypoxylon sp. NC0597]